MIHILKIHNIILTFKNINFPLRKPTVFKDLKKAVFLHFAHLLSFLRPPHAMNVPPSPVQRVSTIHLADSLAT